MSQIKIFVSLASICAAAALVSGCGDFRESNEINAASGKHPDGWVLGSHKTMAAQDVEACKECHGEDLNGGISTVKCSQCHLGGNFDVHPLEWGSYAYARHSRYVKENGTSSCSNLACHGTDLLGVPGSGPSCSSCHLGGSLDQHPAAWGPVNGNFDLSLHWKYGDINGLSSCRSVVCHGANLEGVTYSGPACASCHN